MSWSLCEGDTEKQLRQWYGQFPGKWLVKRERQVLESVLGDLFGYYLMHVGNNDRLDYLDCSRISLRIIMSSSVEDVALASESRDHCVALTAEPEFLPVTADSLDVLILNHTLEFSNNPHQVLRETDRVLIPEGHVIILGFNPWGLWMLWRLAFGWRKKPPWCGRFVRIARLKDWLELLGFDIVRTQVYFFRPPLASRKVMQKLRFVEKLGQRFQLFFGAAYMVVAKKRVATLTPIKPRWRPRRGRLGEPELAGNSSVSSRQKHSANNANGIKERKNNKDG
ncbi:MAG: class I SAM-dependent methyltransferase [Gammaproteobacteria bacterium]|nr:class I SAM-dependent methyltransferase [Gammaproteobacteria bacterium]MDH5799194.1 class I SAM-dependent methyltransferase [Gammaproteobacteria bacterium]